MPMLNQAAAQAPQGAPPPPQGAPQGAPQGGAPGGAPPGMPQPGQPEEQLDPNIGKVDVTTAAGQADPNNVAQATGAAGAVGQARQQVNRQPGLSSDETEATPEEQAAYEEALDAVHQVLYEDPERSKAIAGMLDPRDKIGTLVKTSLQLIQQIDEGVDLHEAVIADIAVDVSDRLIEMAEQVHEMEFSEKETQAVAGATWEGVMELFGMDAGSVEEMTQGMSDEELQGMEDQYKGFVEGKA